MKKETLVRMSIRDVPETLKRQFKGACGFLGVSMSEVLKIYMKKYIKQSGVGKGAGK